MLKRCISLSAAAIFCVWPMCSIAADLVNGDPGHVWSVANQNRTFTFEGVPYRMAFECHVSTPWGVLSPDPARLVIAVVVTPPYLARIQDPTFGAALARSVFTYSADYCTRNVQPMLFRGKANTLSGYTVGSALMQFTDAKIIVYAKAELHTDSSQDSYTVTTDAERNAQTAQMSRVRDYYQQQLAVGQEQRRFRDIARVHAWIEPEDLVGNPFQWRGQRVGVTLTFNQMISEKTALFTTWRNQPVVVTGVPLSAFSRRADAVIALVPAGTTSYAGVAAPTGRYIASYQCGEVGCKDFHRR